MQAFLSGYKTYIVAASLILSGLAGLATGEQTFADVIKIIFSPEVLGGLGLGFLRMGVKKSGA